MSITINTSPIVGGGGQQIGLSSLIKIVAAANDPEYLVVSGLDRNEYPIGATGVTGTLSGNGATANFSSIAGDGRGVGLVFAFQVSSGRYYNTTYGYLDQLSYTSSSSLDDVTSLSFFTTNKLLLANSYAIDSPTLAQLDGAGYLGSVTIATQPTFAGPVPSQATPESIGAAALTFVGQAWNMDGCWILANAIAAEAGASLPMQSTFVNFPGQWNGEWIVAFNGPAGQSGNWQSLVKAGEMISFLIAGGASGHITTCVSGLGGTAMLVDNVTYVNNSGEILNPADDGSSNDVIIAAPHPASQEFSGVSANSVVIYELDTPVVSALTTTVTLPFKAKLVLSDVFGAGDPAGKGITEYQIYDTALTDTLTVNGMTAVAHSPATAAAAASLASVCLIAGSTICTDAVEVRAFNGGYWGDWQPLSVSVAVIPPELTLQTPGQTWNSGQVISFALSADTFVDPNGQTLTYAATVSNGQPLPAWLSFNSTTESFSGTVPTKSQSFGLTVTASDTSGLSASDSFAITVPPHEVAVVASGTAIVAGTGSLVPGAVVTLTLDMSEPVTVAEGTPTLLLNNGAMATFSGWSGTVGLTFTYNVLAGQSTTGLEVTSVNTNGATIADATGNIAVLANIVPNLAGMLQIDEASPQVTGTTGNDMFTAGGGNWSFNGNGGHDAILFDGASTQSTISGNADGSLTIIDNVVGRDGTDHTTGIEFLKFTDNTIFVENSDNANLARLYSAAFARTPDPSGLTYWEDVYANGVPASLKTTAMVALARTTPTGMTTSVAQAFINSAEFQHDYATDITDTAFLTHLYFNTLGRAPDSDGLNYWLNVLHSGEVVENPTIKAMVLVDFAESAENIANTSYGADHTSGWLFAV